MTMNKTKASYVDEVRIEVWGGQPEIRLQNTTKEEFLATLSDLWDTYQISDAEAGGYEPGPVMLRISIEPEAK